MATLPTITQTWKQLKTTGTPGQRIAYVSVLDQMQQYLFGVKDFLCNGSGATTKYTVLWSASGGTGPTNSSDHTDRWTSAATITPRATVAAASQAWAVLTDANGAQILLAFQGASDDICRISFSPGALFALAGTTNQQPTATDEQVLVTATSIVATTTSGDRILHAWASDDGKMCRIGLMRAATLIGVVWGVEKFTVGVSTPASVPVPVWGFCFAAGSTMSAANITGAFTASTRGGYVRTLVSSVAYSCQTNLCVEMTIGGASAPGTYSYQPELQGAGFSPYPCALHSNNQTGSRGRLGNAIDWWLCGPSGVADGDGFGNTYQFIQMGGALWPNPSNTAPTIS